MGRIRTVKPEFWTSETLSTVSAEACLLAVALLNYCDDEGYFNARPELIKAACFPIRNTPPIRRLLVELSTIGYVQLVERSSKTIGLVTGFREHQKVDRARPSSLRRLFETNEPENTELLTVESDKAAIEGSSNDRRGLVAGMEGNGSGNGKDKDHHSIPSNVEEVREYVKTKGYTFAADAFYAYYEANGWKIGRNSMKNWRSACAMWQQRTGAPTPDSVDPGRKARIEAALKGNQ